MVPSSTYPDGQLALVVQARGRLLLVFLFRRSRVVAQGKCRVGGSAETLQCKRQIQAFPTSSQPHPQGAPRGDVTCTTTVLLQWNLARGARELQSRLEYVPVPVVIPKKTEQNGQKQHCPAMCNVCREPSSTLQREASREQSLPAWTQLVRTCCDPRTCQSLQLHQPKETWRTPALPSPWHGDTEVRSEALGAPRLLNPNGAQNSRPLEGLGLLEQHQQHAQDGCLDCAWCHRPGTLAQLATEQTDVPRTASGSNGRLVG